MTKAKGSALAKARATLGSLSLGELKQLRADVDALIAILEVGEEADLDFQATTQAPAGQGAKGHVEEKMIRGFGPYLYLRVWKGKTLTSTYIGKKAKND